MERIKAGFKPLWRRHTEDSFGVVVGEPLARFVGCYLNREPRVHLSEQWSCCRFELIPISPTLLRNGTA